MVPIPVKVVESDHVTLSQVVVEVVLQPGLLTDAVNVKFSVVPTVAVVGVMAILIPVTIVSVAVAVLVVSACAVAMMVTVGAAVVVPFEVTVGSVPGAVYNPAASIEPHVLAVTPVSQVRDQVIAVLLEPVTIPLNCCVRLVITLAVVGEIVRDTPEELLEPHPAAPSTAARIRSAQNLQHVIPALPKFPSVRPRAARTSSERSRPALPSILQSHIVDSVPRTSQLKRPAHREPQRANRIEEIRPLRVVE
jgi:hypothetical protein